MARLFLAVILVFLVLLALRAVRLALSGLFPRGSDRRASAPVEAEMVRDPVCGAWVDRRIAQSVPRAGKTVPVCSDRCRMALEKQA